MNENKREEYTSILASNLPTLRKACGMSQKHFADIIGVSRSTISVIEAKKTMTWNMFLSAITIFTRHEEAKKFMEILGIDLDELNNFLDSA